MNHLPRIAVGSVRAHDDLRVILWALMNVFEHAGVHVQSFSSQSRSGAGDAALRITGQGRRYLDSWLMQPSVCAELFYQGSRSADIGLVDGLFDVADSRAGSGGSLDTLCQWLDLPRLAVVNADEIKCCQLPPVPSDVSGIIIDKVESIERLCYQQTALESYYGVPVVGSMRRYSHLRSAVESLPRDVQPSLELCNALGCALAPDLRLDRLFEIAARRDFELVKDELFCIRTGASPLSVAIAHDDAFNCYFPDTLDVLEAQGATVNFFSPLSSEAVPSGTDVVLLGCGQVDRYASDLAGNICMQESLWSHVVGGGRVYAEAAGLAYLCREITLPSGRRWPMVGLLPALSRYRRPLAPEQAVEVTTGEGSWLFPAGERVRGYLDANWIIHPDGCLNPLVSQAEHRHDLVGDYQIVGSRVRLNFAAHPNYVERIFHPCRSARLKPVS